MQSTELRNRILWFDGDSSYDPSTLTKVMRMFDIQYVHNLTPEVVDYNKNVSREQELRVKTTCKPLDYTWNIPEEYKNLDIIEYVTEKHMALTSAFSSSECELRDLRLVTELRLYEKNNFFDLLRAVIYIINKLTDNNIVWGVGRGSSVSSYVLYVIGVHDVDSFEYELDIKDFIN